jgi:hypothetical protein
MIRFGNLNTVLLAKTLSVVSIFSSKCSQFLILLTIQPPNKRERLQVRQTELRISVLFALQGLLRKASFLDTLITEHLSRKGTFEKLLGKAWRNARSKLPSVLGHPRETEEATHAPIYQKVQVCYRVAPLILHFTALVFDCTRFMVWNQVDLC